MHTLHSRASLSVIPALILALSFVSVSRAEIIMGPYLQNPATDGITVIWHTDGPGPSSVLYWRGGSEVLKASGEDGTVHEVRLAGLAEDAEYHYRVTSGKDKSEQYTFRTATHRPVPFRFVAFGDSRGNDDTVEEVSGRVSRLDPPARFAIHTGDIVNDGRKADDWDEQFFGPQHPMMASLPVFFALGNHENDSELYYKYLAMPGNERWYAFEYGDAVFICLDTNAQYDKGSPQYGWFVSALKEYSGKRWKFVFFHHPPYSTSYHGPDKDVQDILVPLFEKNGVDIVFNGHEHNYERTEVNGVTYVVTGGFGAPRYPKFRGADESRTFSFKHHFCVLDVARESVSLTVIEDDGDILDEYVLVKQPLPAGPSGSE